MKNLNLYTSIGGYPDEIKVQKDIARSCEFGIIELGVLFGDTTKSICEANPDIPVFGIDPIIPDSMNDQLIGSLDRIANNTRDCPNFVFINDYSYNVIKYFEDRFDYIFIDASHHYKDVKQDFQQWFEKLEKGGCISFHDSGCTRGGPPEFADPSRLTDELIQDDRLEYVLTVCSLTIFRKK